MNDALFYTKLQRFAENLSKQAAEMLVSQEKNFTIRVQKDIVDVATSADIAVEQYIKEEVRKQYPDHGFYGEEFGIDTPNARFVWTIDPLDGTKDYVRGIGEYNTLIGVEDQGAPVVGVVRRIGHNQLYSCSIGQGAFCDGRKITVSKTSNLDTAFVGIDSVNTTNNSSDQIDQFYQLSKKLTNSLYRLRFHWDDSRLLSLVSQGSFDATIILPNVPKWFDIAPALLLVEEAGGKVTNWHGEPIKNRDVSKGILASNGMLHDSLLKIISSI